MLKGVPARTTQTIPIGGVLNREAMDLVLNPHDFKAIEAADFLKRKVGGKSVALTMGPDSKLIPLMRPLYDSEVLGIDEEYVLSDRRMAGSDTLATSYALALGVKKLVEKHVNPLDELAEVIKKSGYSEAVKVKAEELYTANMLPNRVYSELPSVRDSIVHRFLEGKITSDSTTQELSAMKESVSRFVIVAGIKTTDGETGSVGPQVAEGLSELMDKVIPHATYVEDFDMDASAVSTQRMIGYLSQKLEMQLPCVLTISPDYRPRETAPLDQPEVRLNNYKGKVLQAFKWTAADLGADLKRLGLTGSPTIVGTGIDLGKPPVQKAVGTSLVFVSDIGQVEFGDKKYGPYLKGDLADGLPEPLLSTLRNEGKVRIFGYDSLAGELFA